MDLVIRARDTDSNIQINELTTCLLQYQCEYEYVNSIEEKLIPFTNADKHFERNLQ